jgi:hypothetical protein
MAEEDLAAIREREQQELLDYPDGRLLSADVAEGVLGVLRALEQNYEDRLGWDGGMPVLGVLALGRPSGPKRPDGMLAVPLTTLPLRLGRDFWALYGHDVMGTVQAIASIAERDPSAFDAFREQAGVPTDQPVIGWFSMVEAYERRVEDLDNPVSAAADPRLAVDELRQLVCVDVDERIFDVIRRRSTGRQTSGGGALPRYRREFAADVEAAGGIPEGVRASGEGLPLMVDALLRLTRVTRAETELRAALAEAGQ